MKGVIKGHKPKETYWIDGKPVSKETFEEYFPDRPMEGCAGLIGWKPLVSDAAAVHPKLVKDHREGIREKGLVGVDVKDNGQVVFNSRSARTAYFKAYNLRDNNAGYGDWAGKSIREPEPAPDWHPDLMQGNTRRFRNRDEEDRAIRQEAEQIVREILELEKRG